MARRSYGVSRGSESAGDDLWAVIRGRARMRDLAGLAAVPAALLAVYVLPLSVKRELILDYNDPTVLTAYASHFVHFSPNHLFTNLSGYALIAVVAYLLALAVDRRRQFLVVLVTFNLAIPFAVSGMNLLWGWPGFGFGYSGVVMALLGYLPVVLMEFVGARFGFPVGQRQSLWLFLVCVAVAGSISLPLAYSVPLVAVAALGVGAFVWKTARDLDAQSLSEARETLGVPGNLELAALGGLVIVFYPFVAFSSTLAVADGILNVFAHGLGLCLGFTVTYVGVWTGWLDY